MILFINTRKPVKYLIHFIKRTKYELIITNSPIVIFPAAIFIPAKINIIDWKTAEIILSTEENKYDMRPALITFGKYDRNELFKMDLLSSYDEFNCVLKICSTSEFIV